MIHWLVTSSPKLAYSQAPSAVNGWKLHAIEAPPNATISDVNRLPAACGLRGRHGWDVDLFIEDKCKRCQAALRRNE